MMFCWMMISMMVLFRSGTPIYDAVSIVNTNDCTNATIISIHIINNVNGIAKAVPITPPPVLAPESPNMKIKPTKLKIAMWPAEIFPAKRSINVNGFMKSPIISTAAKSGFTKTGTFGIQKICCQ